MTDVEVADLVARLLVGTFGDIEPIAAETRAELDRFTRAMVIDIPRRDAFIALRDEAFKRYQVAEDDIPSRDLMFVKTEEGYLECLVHQGVAALNDWQLMALLTETQEDMNMTTEILYEDPAVDDKPNAPEWSAAFEALAAKNPGAAS